MIKKILNYNLSIHTNTHKCAQTFVEYTLLFSIVIAIFVAMAPMVKRTTSGMVRSVADQVGVQKDADQPVDAKSGHLVNSVAKTHIDSAKIRRDFIREVSYEYAPQRVTSKSWQTTNLGFTDEE